MPAIATFLNQVRTDPTSVQFAEVIAPIDEHYTYVPCAFDNGATQNAAGANEGSCKILAFAQLHGLDQEQTLQLFGDYYRVDVLQNPRGGDHGNIGSFMQTGWPGVQIDGTPLTARL